VSLINQLLQDLERRRAIGPENRSLAPPVRALPARSRRAVALLTLLLSAAVAAAGGWLVHTEFSRGRRAESATQSVAPPRVAPPAPSGVPPVAAAASGALPEEEAAARAALTVPVFQFAQELRFAPSVAPKGATSTPRRGQRMAAVRPPAASTASLARERDPSRAAQAAAPASDAAVAAEASPASAPEIQEVVIPELRAPVPVEKQLREPTAYERAELEFRNAVSRLRQGRVGDAEAGLRAALNEDRSHSAARQALIALLIDSGRNADAEQVLRETLAVNPRQPRHAMLLARLELERGDAAAAAGTLEAARQYAGVDAEYFAFLAAVYQRLGRHEPAVQLYTDALSVAPGNAIWMMGLGISLQALQRAEEARSAFRSAAESKTLNPELQAFVEGRIRELSALKR
jgi:MSHA biogenesis protein MshN